MTERLLFNPSTYYFNYNAIIPAFGALVLLTIITYVFFKEKKSAVSISFIIYCLIDHLPAYSINIYPYSFIFLIIGLTYLFNARPWSGIKEETLLKQKEKEEYSFIFDDNIDKL